MVEAKFHSSEVCARAILDGTREAFVGVNSLNTVVTFNPGAEALFALPASAVVGRLVDESGLPEPLRRCIIETVHRAKAGEPVARRRLEIEGLRADGGALTAGADVFAVRADEEILIIAHIHDHTRRRQADKKTQRLSQILRTMSAGNQAMIRAANEDDLFQTMCRVIVEFGGYRMAWIGLVEHDDEETFRPVPVAHAGHEAGYLALAIKGYQADSQGRGPFGMSVRTGAAQFNNDFAVNPAMEPWRDAALERGYRSSLHLPLKDQGVVFGALSIYAGEANAFGPEEVTLLVELAENVSYGIVTLRARRAHDEMERTLQHTQKLEAIGQLTGGIAHDFNNLLQIIDSSANVVQYMMQRSLDDAPRREAAIEAILSASERASSITRHLLAFSRRDALKAETIEPSLEAPKWRDLMSRTTREGVRIEVVIQMGTWPIYCDPNSLEIALINLAVNARDAMPHGGALVVSTRNVSFEGRDFVEIEVADTGCGIDPEDLTHVFEPFFTTKPVGKGTGLGLSQVYGFATQSGGDVRIASEPGQGTKITLRLPRSQETDATKSSETSEPIVLGLRLLVVDDNVEVALAAQNMASALGCRVTVADSPAKALSDIENGEFDVLLTDVVMPGLSGLELAEAACARHRSVGIVLMSGYSEAIGPNSWGYELLRKPFSASDLETALRRTQARARSKKSNTSIQRN